MLNKRLLSLFIIIFILIISSNFVFANTGNAKVDYLIENNYVQGDSRGYRLNDPITRAEATKMIVEVSGMGNQVPDFKGFKSMFTDINNSHWANGYINVAVINSLVNGYPDKTFKPSNNITYAEVIKMLVVAKGETVDTRGYSGPYWFIPYSIKATEIGITEGVSLSDFTQNATREKVFELVYNTIPKKVFSSFESYKGIIIENNRVSNLKKNEARFIIMDDLNDSDVSSRYKEEEKIKINIPRDIGDVESLLGVVVDIEIDGDNNVSDIALDRSFSYMEGPILANEYDIYLGADGRYYDVDRVLSAIHNDKAYDYDRYIRNLGVTNPKGEMEFLAEFARVTIKNQRIYFVDSYTFDDIALIDSTKYGGSEVFIYDDEIDGENSRISIDAVIGYSYNSGFFNMDIDDIYEGDVIHIYNRSNAIVRIDTEKNGNYEKIIENQGFYFAQIDGKRYQIRESDGRRPVFSIDGEEFYTLYADIASEELYNIRNEKIIYHLDINNHIQSIRKR